MSRSRWTLAQTATLLSALTFAFFGLTNRAMASMPLHPDVSEVDGDGIDNDGDGYIDSADTECGSHYQGFGAVSVGGSGGQVFWVDPLLGDPLSGDTHAGTFADPCSFRKAVLGGPNRVVKFMRGGTITLTDDIVFRESNITVDGFSAPSPGVTITQNSGHPNVIISPNAGTIGHDYIINHLLFDGLMEYYPNQFPVGWALITVDGDVGGNRATKIVLDHLSIRDDSDKTTLWGAVDNVTISNCFFYQSAKALLVSYYDSPYDLERYNISIHHNVFADNSERNPQLRGWVRTLDYVNNVLYGWGYYGIRIKDEIGEQKVYANLVNNYFFPISARSSALIFGIDPGPDSYDNGPSTVLPQGTVYTQSSMGQLWVAGNILPPQNMDQYSTISQALDIPASAAVPTLPAGELYKTAWQVGPQFKDTREQTEVNKVMAAITPTSGVLNAAMFYNNSAFDTADDANAIASDKQPLLPGQTASFANYTSYSRGINGLMIDLPNATGVDASDFTFQVGNSGNLADWQTAPAPESVAVLPDQGIGGSDRVKITWADGAVANTWLRVTVKASAGIPSDYVFYVGNCIGDTGDGDPRVSPADAIAVRNHGAQMGGANVANAYDFDRDSKVGPSDQVIARNHGNTAETTLQMITAP